MYIKWGLFSFLRFPQKAFENQKDREESHSN